MNPTRAIYGRVTINGDKYDFTRAPNFAELLRRLAVTYNKHKYDGNKLQLVFEASYDELPTTAIMTREQQLEAEMQSMVVVYEDDDILPNGIPAKKFWDMMDDSDYLRYRELCQPANRVGVENSIVESIKQIARDKFGDDLDKAIQWRDF